MTIQEAAYQILQENGHPLSHKEIAKIALERGMVTSNSSDPVFSLGTTLLKNIRENKYNVPRLCFIGEGRGRRVIGLPEWEEKDKKAAIQSTLPKTIEMDKDTFEMINLAKEAGLGNNEPEIINNLIHAGFKALASEIDSGLSRRAIELKKRMTILAQNND